MAKEEVTAVFDIGKTNKKFFLFDNELNEISHEYLQFNEIEDDDGFPSEDLTSLIKWMQLCIKNIQGNKKIELRNLNFSTYGASLVHLDGTGRIAAPFYNYLKTMESDVLTRFFEAYDRHEFSKNTASPIMGWLNSGFQLFYLKYFKPSLFNNIQTSLHFPQYLSSLFTKKYFTDYTSIGCHTAFWDFKKSDYHNWVKEENMDSLLTKVYPSAKSVPIVINNKKVKVGIGVHDSSAAMVPYLKATNKPFVLVSTGTWSICMNFFNKQELTFAALDKDCLNFLSTSGTNVKASRLFLGQEIKEQVRLLSNYFGDKYDTYKTITFNPKYTTKKKNFGSLKFRYKYLKPSLFGYSLPEKTEYSIFDNYEEAYHKLMDELTTLQIESLKLAIGSSEIKDIYIDGGFTSNQVFMQLLANKLPDCNIYATSFSLGTALGAALLVNQRNLPNQFLQRNYNLKLQSVQKY